MPLWLLLVPARTGGVCGPNTKQIFITVESRDITNYHEIKTSREAVVRCAFATQLLLVRYVSGLNL